MLTAAAAVVDGGNDGDGGGEVLQKTREIFVSFFPFGLFFNWIFFLFFFFSLSLFTFSLNVRCKFWRNNLEIIDLVDLSFSFFILWCQLQTLVVKLTVRLVRSAHP